MPNMMLQDESMDSQNEKRQNFKWGAEPREKGVATPYLSPPQPKVFDSPLFSNIWLKFFS